MSERFVGVSVFQVAWGSKGLAKECLAFFDRGRTFVTGQPGLQLGSLDIGTQNCGFQLACADQYCYFINYSQ